MQIVVNIDEYTYKDIKKGKIYSSIRDVPQESVLAIANGTPLLKGHGDLIDRKDLTPDADYEDGIFGAVSCQQIVEAEAVIEADEEENEETETWNGFHGQITAPKGTFERIFNDADDDNDI